MRAIALLCAFSAAAGTATSVVTSRAGAAERASAAKTAAVTPAEIGHYRRIAWRWQRTMGTPRTRSSFSAERSPDPAYRRWVLRLWQQRARRAQREASVWLSARVRLVQARVGHLERVMGIRRGPLRQTASAGSLVAREASLKRWSARARKLERQVANPPFEAQWQCIHRHEGSWTDGGAPYYGGLQMDISFQRRYGAYLLRTKGTADRWTPAEQMWVATHALRSGRGFGPWPNTARACGLL
jgi:hypothetical protein